MEILTCFLLAVINISHAMH